jgi:rod shape determining protein RodA
VRKKIRLGRFDKLLFFAPITIFLIGVLSIYSSSFKAQQPLDDTFAARQFLWMGIGALTVFLVVRWDYFKWVDFAWPLYFLSIFFLVAVLFTPARLGARRWIEIGGFNFQPSELAKLAVILVLSRFFSTHRSEFIPKTLLMVPFAVVALPILLILKEPDLGTALILVPIFFAMLYLWGFDPRKLLLLVAAAVLLSPVFFMFLKEYQRTRLLVFINPNLDPLGAGYTIIQSKIAVGSGGLFGKGFMGGTQNQLNFLPERHTDFIFGVIGEEGGFVASILVVTLFWLIVRRGYQICGQTPDRLGSQLACGITTMVGIQAIINLGMTMGLLPVVGVPLPLISYGGTSVVMTMFAIGLLINIKIHRSLF